MIASHAKTLSLVPGGDIDSTHVDENATYLSLRTIASLQSVKALSGIRSSVANRADGIIENSPADGILEADELASLELPHIFPTLFPEEQAVLPELWAHMRAPEQTADAVVLPDTELSHSEHLTPPTDLIAPDLLVIDILPSHSMRQACRRVQLVFDSDDDPDTVSIEDVEQVIAAPGAFTPSEINQLELVPDEFYKRAVSNSDARATVPEPGIYTTNFAIGDTTFRHTSQVMLEEVRQYDLRSGSLLRFWTSALDIRHETFISAVLPLNQRLVLIDKASGEETIVQPNAPALELPAGDYIVEQYSPLGERLDSSSVTLPALAATSSRTSLDAYLDYDLFLDDGTQLVKNAISTDGKYLHSSTYRHTATFRWGKTVVPPGSAVSTHTVDRAATPALAIATGAYDVTLGDGRVLRLDLYPQGVVIATLDDVSTRLKHHYLYDAHFTSAKMLRTQIGTTTIEITLSSFQLHVQNTQAGTVTLFNQQLKSEDRVQ